jgi:hypothetical protein
VCEKACAVVKARLTTHSDVGNREQNEWQLRMERQAVQEARVAALAHAASAEGHAHLSKAALALAYADADRERRRDYEGALDFWRSRRAGRIRELHAAQRASAEEAAAAEEAALLSRAAELRTFLTPLTLEASAAAQAELSEINSRLALVAMSRGGRNAEDRAGAAATRPPASSSVIGGGGLVGFERATAYVAPPRDVPLSRLPSQLRLAVTQSAAAAAAGTGAGRGSKRPYGAALEPSAVLSSSVTGLAAAAATGVQRQEEDDHARAAALVLLLRGPTQQQRQGARAELEAVTTRLARLALREGVAAQDAAEAAALAALAARVAARQARYKPLTGVRRAFFTVLEGPVHTVRVETHLRVLRDDLVARREAAAAVEARRSFAVMERIMGRWRSVGLRAVFEAWRDHTARALGRLPAEGGGGMLLAKLP